MSITEQHRSDALSFCDCRLNERWPVGFRPCELACEDADVFAVGQLVNQGGCAFFGAVDDRTPIDLTAEESLRAVCNRRWRLSPNEICRLLAYHRGGRWFAWRSSLLRPSPARRRFVRSSAAETNRSDALGSSTKAE